MVNSKCLILKRFQLLPDESLKSFRQPESLRFKKPAPEASKMNFAEIKAGIACVFSAPANPSAEKRRDDPSGLRTIYAELERRK